MASELLHPEWLKIVIFSFLTVSIINGLLSSFSSAYYKDMPSGRLTHSQLRVKQGTADPEQRFNVFILSIIFGISSFRVLFITLLMAVSVNFLLVLT